MANLLYLIENRRAFFYILIIRIVMQISYYLSDHGSLFYMNRCIDSLSQCFKWNALTPISFLQILDRTIIERMWKFIILLNINSFICDYVLYNHLRFFCKKKRNNFLIEIQESLIIDCKNVNHILHAVIDVRVMTVKPIQLAS